MLRIFPKRTMYMIPYERLINALTREHSAAVRINGSLAASCIWNRVKMALIRGRRSADFKHEAGWLTKVARLTTH